MLASELAARLLRIVENVGDMQVGDELTSWSICDIEVCEGECSPYIELITDSEIDLSRM